jgi:hypothetical protein
MTLLTIVEDFVIAAMRRAVVEETDNGAVGATIPECPGVIAFGADRHQCATELYAHLEAWVRYSLAAGQRLPVIDGINLNSEADRILSSYRVNSDAADRPVVYPNEAALEAAFDEHDAGAEQRRYGSS